MNVPCPESPSLFQTPWSYLPQISLLIPSNIVLHLIPNKQRKLMDLLHSCEITWNNWTLETKNRKAYLDLVKFKTKKKIEFVKTFNLHPNSIYAQGVWSCNQFCTCFFVSKNLFFFKNCFLLFFSYILITVWTIILLNNSY